jgi:uncharacterized membrane protein required for colicin V production
MKTNLPFRSWFYFRTGFAVYLSFVIAAVNMIVTVYYLAIERIDVLHAVFPDFTRWAVTVLIVGVPLAVFIGWLHLKRSPAYSSEVDVGVEANPYYYKLPPGYWKEALVPVLLETMKLNIKLLNKESLTEGEIKSLKDLQGKLQNLIDGGRIDGRK